ncbi:MAG: thermopsin [Candidatus Micrarchaeaceae archaeon]
MNAKIAFLCLVVLSVVLPNMANAQLLSPVYEVNSSTPVAVGAVSYGLVNVQYATGPYQVETNEVVGFSRIDSLLAYNMTPPANISAYGAAIQLNVVLNITGINGNRYYYWLQNVDNLNTSNHTGFLIDNIWNMSEPNASLSSGTLSGYGNVSMVNSSDSFYAYSTNVSAYSYPLFFNPVIRVGISSGVPVVQMGYDQNGTYVFYDNITFNIPARKAYILVTPYYQTPTPANSKYDGNFYDAEMVIAGEGNAEVADFIDANATLWIGYLSGNSLVPFPVVGDFGIDTQEAAKNLNVSSTNGEIKVGLGYLNYNESISQHGVPQALLSQNAASQSSGGDLSPNSLKATTSASTTTAAGASTAPAFANATNGTASRNASEGLGSNALYQSEASSSEVGQAVTAMLAFSAMLILAAVYIMLRNKKPKQQAQEPG